MPDYSNGKVYKLVCDTTQKIYIGSTTLRLCQRLAQHKIDFRLYTNGNKRYSISYEILESFWIIVTAEVILPAILPLVITENGPICGLDDI